MTAVPSGSSMNKCKNKEQSLTVSPKQGYSINIHSNSSDNLQDSPEINNHLGYEQNQNTIIICVFSHLGGLLQNISLSIAMPIL